MSQAVGSILAIVLGFLGTAVVVAMSMGKATVSGGRAVSTKMERLSVAPESENYGTHLALAELQCVLHDGERKALELQRNLSKQMPESLITQAQDLLVTIELLLRRLARVLAQAATTPRLSIINTDTRVRDTQLSRPAVEQLIACVSALSGASCEEEAETILKHMRYVHV